MSADAFVPLGIYLTPAPIELRRDEPQMQPEAAPPQPRETLASAQCEHAMAAARRLPGLEALRPPWPMAESAGDRGRTRKPLFSQYFFPKGRATCPDDARLR